jgi:hypothetical protein
MLSSFKIYLLLPAGRSQQQSGTATNKLIILLERLAGNGRAVSHVLPRLLRHEKGERGEMGDNACCACVRSRHGETSSELHRPTVGLQVGFWEFKNLIL